MPASVIFEGMAMSRERLSRLQRDILAWLVAEDQRLRGTMAASHEDLVRAMAHDKGNLSTSLKGLELKGHSLGTAVFGGMILSTVLSLAVVPVIYVIIERLRELQRQPGARKGVSDELVDAKNSPHEHDSAH